MERVVEVFDVGAFDVEVFDVGVDGVRREIVPVEADFLAVLLEGLEVPVERLLDSRLVVFLGTERRDDVEAAAEPPTRLVLVTTTASAEAPCVDKRDRSTLDSATLSGSARRVGLTLPTACRNPERYVMIAYRSQRVCEVIRCQYSRDIELLICNFHRLSGLAQLGCFKISEVCRPR